jgi:glutathione-regulated potassium-efflux system ancillary protein KefF
MLVVIFAHPYPDRSRANRRLVDAVSKLEGVSVRSLYDLYPGFDIDVPAEQAALSAASTIVWQHPLYWYSVPGLLKHWFDKVLVRGWAYGDGTHALEGKRCLWVVTTGGDDNAYTPAGMHGHPFSAFVPAIEQTARFCHMRWEEPLVLRGAHRVAEDTLDEEALGYRRRLEQLLASPET